MSKNTRTVNTILKMFHEATYHMPYPDDKYYEKAKAELSAYYREKVLALLPEKEIKSAGDSFETATWKNGRNSFRSEMEKAVREGI